MTGDPRVAAMTALRIGIRRCAPHCVHIEIALFDEGGAEIGAGTLGVKDARELAAGIRRLADEIAADLARGVPLTTHPGGRA